MAIRPAAMKAQVIDCLGDRLSSDEKFVACVHGETGGSPALRMLLSRVPLIGLILGMTRRYYFVTLTTKSVVVSKAGAFSNRPGEIVAEFRRSDFPVSQFGDGETWSKFYLQLPDTKGPTRINVHRAWQADLAQFASAFPPEAVPGNAGWGGRAPT